MIIIERSYTVDNPRGGSRLLRVDRSVFSDDNVGGVQKFLDERSSCSGYEWHNLQFKYVKL